MTKYDLSYAIGILWRQRGIMKGKLVRMKGSPRKEVLESLEARKKVLEKAARILTKELKKEAKNEVSAPSGQVGLASPQD